MTEYHDRTMPQARNRPIGLLKADHPDDVLAQFTEVAFSEKSKQRTTDPEAAKGRPRSIKTKGNQWKAISGWWILPAALMGSAIWAVLLALVLF